MGKPKLIHPRTAKLGMNGLHFAAYSGDLPNISLELGNGISPNSRDDQGYTPLHWLSDMAVNYPNRIELLDALLKAGCDINAQSSDGTTALMLSCANGPEDFARALIQRGADCSLRSKTSTVLHEAMASSHLVKILLAGGASPLERNENGSLPSDLARKMDFDQSSEILSLLLEAEGKLTNGSI